MTGTERTLRALLTDTFWGVVVATDPAPLGYYSLSQAFTLSGASKGCGAVAVAPNGSRPALFLFNTDEPEIQRVAALANSNFWVSPRHFHLLGERHKTDMESLTIGLPTEPDHDSGYFILCQKATYPLIDHFNPDLKPTAAFSVGHYED